MIGQCVFVIYRGEKSSEPKEYRGTIESQKIIKGRELFVVKLSDGSGYRSFYADKAERFETV